MTDRLNSGGERTGGKHKFRSKWDAKIAAGTMTSQDWVERGNAHLASIGRRDVRWVIRDKKATIEFVKNLDFSAIYESIDNETRY